MEAKKTKKGERTPLTCCWRMTKEQPCKLGLINLHQGRRIKIAYSKDKIKNVYISQREDLCLCALLWNVVSEVNWSHPICAAVEQSYHTMHSIIPCNFEDVVFGARSLSTKVRWVLDSSTQQQCSYHDLPVDKFSGFGTPPYLTVSLRWTPGNAMSWAACDFSAPSPLVL